MKENQPEIQFVIDVDGSNALSYVNGTLSLSGEDGQWRPVSIRESLSFMNRMHAAVAMVGTASLGDWDVDGLSRWFQELEDYVAGLEATAPFTVEITAALAEQIDTVCKAAEISHDQFVELAMRRYLSDEGGESCASPKSKSTGPLPCIHPASRVRMPGARIPEPCSSSQSPTVARSGDWQRLTSRPATEPRGMPCVRSCLRTVG